MARKTRQEMEELKKKLNVDRLWSFSRINCFTNCSYSYYLKYVKREKEYKTSIYSVLGSAFHDALEDYYNKKINYDEMINRAEKAILEVELSDMKFDSSDNEKNENIKQKYFACAKHFFKNHKTVNAKIMSEKEITIQIGRNYFFGYIDAIHKDEDGYYVITDYKSSTIYQGKKISKEGKQLLLYSLGIYQKGIPIDKIKARWNFLKYLSITYMQKNGNLKTMNAERHVWVGKIKSSLRMFLKDMNTYTPEEIEGLLAQCIELNNIDMLPKEIQEKYSIEDCYVEVPISQNDFDELINSFGNTIYRIYQMEKETDKNKEDYNNKEITEEEMNKRNYAIWKREVKSEHSYFCSNICGFTAGQCTCYKEHLETLNLYKTKNEEEQNDEDWMEQLGLI